MPAALLSDLAHTLAPCPRPSPPTDPPELTTAWQQAHDELTAYVAAVEAQHREQYPDPLRPDGRPRWDADQAALRTGAWTEEENAEVSRLREAERAAVIALHRVRQGGGE